MHFLRLLLILSWAAFGGRHLFSTLFYLLTYNDPIIIAMKKILFIALFMCLLIYSGCAMQKDVSAVDNRLTEMELRDAEARKNREQMEAQITTYRKFREKMDQELRRQSASLHALIEELREEIRILNGKIEELEYSLNQEKKATAGIFKKSETTSSQLTEVTSKNKERIAQIEHYLNLESSGKTAKVPEVVTPGIQAKVQKELTEDEIYKLGKEAFDQGDSAAAKMRFQELIERYPKSEDADNAQFWIGEIYYREKRYKKAILEYDKVIEKYPKGNKVPAALLKQGLAFENIGDKPNSRIILEDLIKRYPTSNEAKIARERLK
jgi:tol-pal system protein YbgF